MLIAIWIGVGTGFAALCIQVLNRLNDRDANRLAAISLIIAALIYVGFALINHDNRSFSVQPIHTHSLALEIIGVALYGAFAVIALWKHPIFAAIGWLLHPVWDVALHLYGPIGHVAPDWYAWMCLSFDVLLAAYLFRRYAPWRAATSTPR